MLTVTKETDVICVLRGSREMDAYSVPLASKEMTATYVLMVTMATPAVSDKQYMCRRWLLGSTDYGAVR